ncbi:acyl-coenzyme A:6-aminopenicillanic-acid-acyltransferase 40 kDa form isoform X1 [Zerene cesonia]|uniref:acyl-coenzyme A:6-aminopenicillanic-acid-acyltransferase 40 kDa form isoform X1 n=1 Tax=Zerene cesonia TaxID=33412 RepID=UPI0018E5A37E|nr:acyl-coenzyme A:6-aminopenicillanic-acid-acyltransferase 40 kDa form isoform X1 [Zerene cesonia]
MFRLLFVVVVFALSGTCEIVGRRRAVPVIHLRGSHYEVGYDVGRTFSSLIKEFIATYANLRDFEKEYKTEPGKEAYEKTLANMKERYPYYVKEMQGVADGAKVPFYQLFLLQLDDIIGTINDNHIPRNDTGGCSSLGIQTPNEAVLAHTEDAFSETLNHFYIMSAHIIPTQEDRDHGAVEERFASLCYAGHMPGYTMGYNENGLVFSINTLSPMILKPGNTPRTFITRALLSAKNLEDATKILTDEGLGAGNGCSVNMIWTDENGERSLYNVEMAPDLTSNKSLLNIKKFENDVLIHTNKYLRLQLKEVDGPIIDSSNARLEAIFKHPTPKTRDDLQDILSDTTRQDFQVFQEKDDSIIKTIAAGVFDLKEKTWNIYINKPNASEPVAILPIRFTNIGK